MSDVIAFYQNSELVNRYEKGRSDRSYFPNLLEFLLALESNNIFVDVPLYSVFDWLYMSRLIRHANFIKYSTILDIGCGTSYIGRTILMDGWRGQLNGFDSSQEMIDMGSRCFDNILEWKARDVVEICEGAYRYIDALGRDIHTTIYPSSTYDEESVQYAKKSRWLLSVDQHFDGIFELVCSFSGPFCFFRPEKQEELILKLCSKSSRAVVLQFKNSNYENFIRSNILVNLTANIIDAVFTQCPSDPYEFLVSSGIGKYLMQNEGNSERSFVVEHESGFFNYWTSHMDDISKWLRAASFEVESFQSFGWMSQIFYCLAKRHYKNYRTTVTGIRKFFWMIEQIENYFCDKNCYGENLQVVAYRRSDTFKRESNKYLDRHEYRCNYYVRE